MKTFKHSILASAAAVALLVTPVYAQDSKEQLTESVTNSMHALDVEPAGFEYLTIEDLSEIKAILESDDQNSAKIENIEEVIATTEELEGTPVLVTNELRDQIRGHLEEMGYDTDVEALSAEQIAQLKAVFDDDDITDEEARGRVDEVLAS